MMKLVSTAKTEVEKPTINAAAIRDFFMWVTPGLVESPCPFRVAGVDHGADGAGGSNSGWLWICCLQGGNLRGLARFFA
jgi:hypothetical protein